MQYVKLILLWKIKINIRKCTRISTAPCKESLFLITGKLSSEFNWATSSKARLRLEIFRLNPSLVKIHYMTRKNWWRVMSDGVWKIWRLWSSVRLDNLIISALKTKHTQIMRIKRCVPSPTFVLIGFIKSKKVLPETSQEMIEYLIQTLWYLVLGKTLKIKFGISFIK